MCRFGCTTTNTTYMCKWCGTRYCKECLKGEFVGEMREVTKCRVCNQNKCQGQRVEYVPRPKDEEEEGKGKRSISASTRGRSAKTSRSARSAKSNKGGKKKGKKSGKKKKKKR